MEKIEKRVARAEYEISRAKEFDRQIVNDDLEKAEAEALQIVNDFLSDEKDKWWRGLAYSEVRSIQSTKDT